MIIVPPVVDLSWHAMSLKGSTKLRGSEAMWPTPPNECTLQDLQIKTPVAMKCVHKNRPKVFQSRDLNPYSCLFIQLKIKP